MVQGPKNTHTHTLKMTTTASRKRLQSDKIAQYLKNKHNILRTITIIRSIKHKIRERGGRGEAFGLYEYYYIALPLKNIENDKI